MGKCGWKGVLLDSEYVHWLRDNKNYWKNGLGL
jgi:hypothetical protein